MDLFTINGRVYQHKIYFFSKTAIHRRDIGQKTVYHTFKLVSSPFYLVRKIFSGFGPEIRARLALKDPCRFARESFRKRVN